MPTILDEIKQLKAQGYQDSAIISYLQEQGVTPKEIQEAIDQTNIKDAVQQEAQQTQNPYQPPQQEYYEDYPGYYDESQQNPEYQQTQTQPQDTYQDYYQQDYSQQNYPQEQYYQNQGAYNYNQNSMAEIAEQVFSEKIKEIEKQIKEFNEFKTLMQTRVEHNTERLKKIENTIDKLQMAILEKIGSYGQNLNSIKKEMSMMQDSFRKMVNDKVSRR